MKKSQFMIMREIMVRLMKENKPQVIPHKKKQKLEKIIKKEMKNND
jgi:hypothetical protein